MMKRFLIASLALLLCIRASAQITGYAYGKEIVIQGSRVSGSLSNFPVLLSITDPDLRTVGSGGHVENSGGYDIVFSSGCTTTLPHQIERYNPSTGGLVVWVQVPALTENVNTSIYMYYGKSGVVSDPSTDAVWDADYVGVYHLSDNNFNDFSAPGTGNNGTNVLSTDVSSAKIAGARGFAANTSYVHLPTAGWSTASGTVSLWGYVFGFPGMAGTHQYFFGHTSSPPGYTDRIQIYTDDVNGLLDFGLGGSHLIESAVEDLNTAQWYYIVMTFDNTNYEIFVNGQPRRSGTFSGLASLGGYAHIGKQGNEVGSPQPNESQNGVIDEVRISTIARSSDWILTQYRNQNTPSTFYTVSAEMTGAATCALPVELLLFEAIWTDGDVKLVWTTATEHNNSHFTVERSANGSNWEEIVQVPGAGSSDSRSTYQYFDTDPYDGLSYYRIRQTDYDGSSTYSWIRSVNVGSDVEISIYPNPASEEFFVELSSPSQMTVRLFNSIGQPVGIDPVLEGNSVIVNVSGLNRGLYFVQIDDQRGSIRKVIVLK